MKGTLKDLEKIEFDLIIIDGMNLVYKYHYIMKNLSSKDGTPTGVWYGCLNCVHDLRNRYKKAKIIFAWDSRTSKKKEINPTYKANRVHTEGNGFWDRLDKLKKLLSLYNVDQCYADGYEADDIAAKLVEENKDKRILLMSTDNDWHQMLDENVMVYKNGINWNRSQIEEKYEVNVKKQTLIKSFIGEAKENVKGIPRIPRKLVNELAERYDSLYSIFESIEKNGLSKLNKWGKIILDNKEKLLENHKLKELIIKGYELQEIEKRDDIKKLCRTLAKYDMSKLCERIKNE